MSQKQTYYSKDWEKPERYLKISKLVVGKEGSTGYSCRICNSKTLQLGNMGVEALKKHLGGDSLKKKVEEHGKEGLSQPTVSSLFLSCSSSKNVQSNIALPSSQPKKTTILLALKSVMSHLSQRCVFKALLSFFQFYFQTVVFMLNWNLKEQSWDI